MTQQSHPLARLSRRQILKGGAALAGTAAVSSLVSVEVLGADAAKVNMQLGWLASNGIMGEIVAKRTGIYEELGIELEVTPGGPGVDGVASVAAGRAGVGHLSSSPSLMLARSAGIPVKAFAAGYQKHPFT
ncbi:MAG: ABC transporter substrate-binding protein, partial [Rhodospirillales bacterium]|nr:ABC transporter substrate-binding protein [Rhodospirillales bacterium]